MGTELLVTQMVAGMHTLQTTRGMSDSNTEHAKEKMLHPLLTWKERTWRALQGPYCHSQCHPNIFHPPSKLSCKCFFS